MKLRENRSMTMPLAMLSLFMILSAFCVQPIIAQFERQTKPTKPTFISWATKDWSGDDEQYVRVRDEVDSDFTDGKVTSAYLSDLETKWKQNKTDPLILFRWAYAHQRARDLHPPLEANILIPGDLFNAAPAPHSYQYTRIRFLAETNFGSHRELLALGKRLLSHEPNDFYVEYAVGNCFGEKLTPAAKQEALTYTDHMLQKYPTRPSVYALKGGTYFSYWIDHRNKQDARDAIKWYKIYLKKAPANYEWRTRAQGIITFLQTHQ